MDSIRNISDSDLNKLHRELRGEMVKVLNTDEIRWYELHLLKMKADAEIKRRAENRDVTKLGEEFGILVV